MQRSGAPAEAAIIMRNSGVSQCFFPPNCLAMVPSTPLYISFMTRDWFFISSRVLSMVKLPFFGV